MDSKGWMMLKVLINRFNPKAGDTLIKFLPQEETPSVTSQDIRSNDLLPLLYQSQRTLDKTHYSWLVPLITKFPEPLRPFVISSLLPEQQAGLTQENTGTYVSPPVKNFLRNQLYRHLKANQHLPLEYIPETDFSPLLQWKKRELVRLIDFLGMHDLAFEIRGIVNKNYLKNLYSCLSPKELYYLKVCLHQKERLVSPKLGIDPTKQDCPRLRQVLHRRGLIRLGKALAGQHADLVWYIAHALDTGRGRLLLRYYQPHPIPNVTPILKQQVFNVITFMKKE